MAGGRGTTAIDICDRTMNPLCPCRWNVCTLDVMTKTAVEHQQTHDALCRRLADGGAPVAGGPMTLFEAHQLAAEAGRGPEISEETIELLRRQHDQQVADARAELREAS